MIERYTLPEMGRVWSEAHKYELWCSVEVMVLEAHAEAGTVPASSVEPVRAAPPSQARSSSRSPDHGARIAPAARPLRTRADPRGQRRWAAAASGTPWDDHLVCRTARQPARAAVPTPSGRLGAHRPRDRSTP